MEKWWQVVWSDGVSVITSGMYEVYEDLLRDIRVMKQWLSEGMSIISIEAHTNTTCVYFKNKQL